MWICESFFSKSTVRFYYFFDFCILVWSCTIEKIGKDAVLSHKKTQSYDFCSVQVFPPYLSNFEVKITGLVIFILKMLILYIQVFLKSMCPEWKEKVDIWTNIGNTITEFCLIQVPTLWLLSGHKMFKGLHKYLNDLYLLNAWMTDDR